MLLTTLQSKLTALKAKKLYKTEQCFSSPQGPAIQLNGKTVINLCSNNYLGLANHPAIVSFTQTAIQKYGYGLSSVRFICGTQTIHQQLEERLSEFLEKEATILFPSCFDANTGIFEALLGQDDYIFSDSLNHASIIDGIRLCKATCLRHPHNDMQQLATHLKQQTQSQNRLIATDGVFSMDGTIANIPQLAKLAKEHQALLMVDDSHGVGVLGPSGQGTPFHYQLQHEVDILTGTLGKALGGAAGGYVAGKKEIILWLRQTARPYLFSNSIAPMIAATTLYILDFLKEQGEALRQTLFQNLNFFTQSLSVLGFQFHQHGHPIVPVFFDDEEIAFKMAKGLLDKNILAVNFAYPVVPKGQARIRVQISSAHTQQHLEQALDAFAAVGKQLGII